jgi:YtkA-like
MRVFAVVGAVVCALVLPTLAAAGGWATVGFEPLPDGTAAGGTWKPIIFVKRHGITPLEGLQPVVVIEETRSGESTTFLATAGSEPGVYDANVVFPSAGDWRITILSGFGDSRVTYGPVAIGEAAPGGGTEPLPVIGFGVLALAILGVVGAFAARRARRLTPASG